MDSIVHFEIPADDPKRASKFYSDVFGWQVQAMEGFPYWSLITTELDSTTFDAAKQRGMAREFEDALSYAERSLRG